MGCRIFFFRVPAVIAVTVDDMFRSLDRLPLAPPGTSYLNRGLLGIRRHSSRAFCFLVMIILGYR